jgi:tetratricopeptide (TPR) repeat protein
MMLTELSDKQRERGEKLLLLSGSCESGDSSRQVPYALFYDLLDSTMTVDLFGRREKNEKVENAIRLASKFMMGPVASFLVAGGESEQRSFSKNDIFIQVKKRLRALAKESPVVLFIDDLQWIDSASEELLNYLLHEFPEQNEDRIFFLFTVRSTDEGWEKINRLSLENHVHEIGFIDRSEQRQLLGNAFCMAPETTRWIIDWTAEQNEEKVYPYILVDVVGSLVRQKQLYPGEQGFVLNKDFDFSRPPIPEGPKNEVDRFMSDHPEYRDILTLAAMLGKEFRVSHLALGLDLPYLECIELLDEISESSGLVYDVTSKDDIYRFRSQIILDAIRENTGYSESGIGAADVSQLIRHFHALAAMAWEKELRENYSAKAVMTVAAHYYVAGRLYADKAIHYNLEAAKTARNLFEYDKALDLLNRVDEVAEATGKEVSESTYLRVLIECDRSNVRGVDADKAAFKAMEYIASHTEVPDELLIATARANYDAEAQLHSQEWFARTVRFCEENLLARTSKVLLAEGHHFIGISLNRRDPELSEKRMEHLRKAVSLAKELDDPMIYAKVANSLAEALSYGDDRSKEEAKKLFEESLKIKENAPIKDLPGIARTYGGLGRLAFFSQPPNIDEARKFFLKDLEISEEISDQRGISQMNSFLGSCALQEDRYQEAVKYYDRSIELKNNYLDLHASYHGKILALEKLGNKEDLIDTFASYTQDLESFGAPPETFIDDLIRVAKGSSAHPEAEKFLNKLDVKRRDDRPA